jgi:hypothetical protein
MTKMPKSLADKLREAIRAELAKGRTLNEIAKTADVKHSVTWRFMNDPNKTLTLETANALAKSVGIKLTLG